MLTVSNDQENVMTHAHSLFYKVECDTVKMTRSMITGAFLAMTEVVAVKWSRSKGIQPFIYSVVVLRGL